MDIFFNVITKSDIMSHEAKEWSKATIRCKNSKRGGIHLYIDFDTINISLRQSGIKQNNPLEVKKYPLKGSDNYAKILLKFRVDKNPKIKEIARSKLNNAVKYDKIIKPHLCSANNCNEMIVEAHHKDYLKPLDVIWLCSYHHKKLHSGEKLKFRSKQ